MAYKITGRILSAADIKTLTSKNGTAYRKRDFVIAVRKFDPYTGVPSEDEGNTPVFTLFGDRCNDLEGMNLGDLVTVHFELDGRSYEKDGETCYFTEVRPLRIEKASPGSVAGREAERQPMSVEVAEPYGKKVSVAELMEPKGLKKEGAPESDEDLPF